MSTESTAHTIEKPTSILVSLEDDAILIENPTEVTLTREMLTPVASSILSWFCNGKLCETPHINSFLTDILGGMPSDGGAIPVDNVLDWIQLEYPDAQCRLTSVPKLCMKTFTVNKVAH
ncbi:hypothetical protein [Alteromonas macleodii]|uniref:Uncharacterized protein n=1 Tax=Alteromonas macleodii TaxID=28108 RepID=A0AB36FL46_ALTMA|nr:hypothetical protein [Alteromonas macleodii]OES24206.1 hypothetical protein BFV93_4806 [Alteromonas macleodii]OES24838.1 hypothetical protein BFV95_4597 [Alteromonas macleodii]OES25116.1 hypothetical protein BFV94_4587 [Alteromonas macleodii]OES39159.1 hypothetical protein BFV96_4307 [Alteromonas macleodii]